MNAPQNGGAFYMVMDRASILCPMPKSDIIMPQQKAVKVRSKWRGNAGNFKILWNNNQDVFPAERT